MLELPCSTSNTQISCLMTMKDYIELFNTHDFYWFKIYFYNFQGKLLNCIDMFSQLFFFLNRINISISKNGYAGSIH